MQNEELLRIVIFLSSIAIVYLLALVVSIRLLIQKLGYIQLSTKTWLVVIRRAVLSLALIGIVCFAYAYIEPYWPSVTHIQIRTGKLQPDSREVRIVHISDLHSDSRPRLEEKLPDIIAAERPDLVIFTGDTINSPDGVETARKFMTRVAKIAPTYVVKGNWDSWYWYEIDLFEGTGVKELKGTAEKIQVGKSALWINGLPVGSEDKLEYTFDEVPQDAFKIFLYHYPDLIEKVSEKKIDLYCAGHTHGGQIALPFYGALVTLSKFGKKYESGLYKVDQTWLYVNRGIGMEGGDAPRVRFFARPEVTVIELKSND